jgi:hypothetical protein
MGGGGVSNNESDVRTLTLSCCCNGRGCCGVRDEDANQFEKDGMVGMDKTAGMAVARVAKNPITATIRPNRRAKAGVTHTTPAGHVLS